MPIRRSPGAVTNDELAALLARYEAGTEVTGEGVLQFLHIDFEELERILPDAFEADPSFTARQKREILRRALRDCRKRGRITPVMLLDEARRQARERLQRPELPFAMWTKFRARNMAFAPGFRLNWAGVSLEARDDLPRFMRMEEYFLNGHGRIFPHQPVFYGYLIARCQAREADNAVAGMLDATDVFMAVFNFYALFGSWGFSDGRWAKAKLWHGPYHFVFEKGRFIGNERLWYNPTFDEEHWGMFPPDMTTVHKVLPRVRRALAALAGHPFREVLLNVLRLMQNAMASKDQSYSLLRYWSALEQLYGEPQSREKNYSRIIQRASVFERDRLVARWKLNHISRQRNEYVHAGDNDDDLQAMAQYLRDLLSRHVNYLIFHAPHVGSHADWLEIVDLPADEKLLARRREAIDRRLALIEEGRRDA